MGMSPVLVFRSSRFCLLLDPPSFPLSELVVQTAALLHQSSGGCGSNQAPLISPWYGYWRMKWTHSLKASNNVSPQPNGVKGAPS
jgi:hypothetical protein